MKSRARILIVSSGSPCRNPRPWKEASSLAEAGHDVTLLTPASTGELAEHERTLIAGTSVRHHTLAAPAARWRQIARRAARALACRGVPLGLQHPRALGVTGDFLRQARTLPADLTIVHNEGPFWIGRELQHAGRRVAADFEDWYSEDLLPADRRYRPLELLRKLERHLLHTAAFALTTSRALSSALAAHYAAPAPEVLPNAFPLQPALSRTGRAGPPAFFWFSQTIGPGRGLEEFCSAWVRTTSPSRLALLGRPASGFMDTLLAGMPEAFRPRVTVLPLVAPTQLPDVIARHDIGLALEDASIRSRDLTITNKILQYLNAGLAVLATPTAGQREVLADAAGAGQLVSLAHPAELARELDALLGMPEKIAAMQRAARQAAEMSWCWERHAPRLLDIVDRALRVPAGTTVAA